MDRERQSSAVAASTKATTASSAKVKITTDDRIPSLMQGSAQAKVSLVH